jgi:hypothetical protein
MADELSSRVTELLTKAFPGSVIGPLGLVQTLRKAPVSGDGEWTESICECLTTQFRRLENGLRGHFPSCLITARSFTSETVISVN